MPPKAPTKAASKASKAPKKPTSFTCTVSGLYRASTPSGDQVTKPYELTAKLPLTVMHQALPTFKKLYLKENNLMEGACLLKRTYPDCEGVYTHEIKSIQLPDNMPAANSVDLMSREQLDMYILEQGINLVEALYPNLQDMKAAVKEWEADPEAFYQYQDKRYESLKDDLELVAQVKALNEDEDVEAETETTEAEDDEV
jgi:hypothetical protein